MISLRLFLPCAGGVETYLAEEVARICGEAARELRAARGGVQLTATWPEVMKLNLHSRLAQRVLVQLAHVPYRGEDDLYEAAQAVAWEQWFTPRESFKIELTAHQSPLKSLNFAALRIKDAVADRFRARGGVRPDVDTQRPAVRLFAHLTADTVTLYVDSSGEPLFKRGWREDKGEAPLKETLAAAMLAASGWQADKPLYDPCCGSGTIAIEAAQIACNIAPGLLRRFGFERLKPHVAADWLALKAEAQAARRAPTAPVFGSDVAFRMVDFAQRNAQRCQHVRHRHRHHHLQEYLEVGGAQGARHPDVYRADLHHAFVHDDHRGEERRVEQDHDLGQLADAQVHDYQRDQRDRRQRAEEIDQRVDEAAHRPVPADQEADGHCGDHAQQQAGQDPLQGHRHVQQQPGLRQAVPECLQDFKGRGQQPRIHQAGNAQQPPENDQACEREYDPEDAVEGTAARFACQCLSPCV